MRKISKKVRITTLISLMLVLGGISLFLFMVKQNEKAMLNQEKERAAVVLADNETRVLFFYKDTCADCQRSIRRFTKRTRAKTTLYLSI